VIETPAAVVDLDRLESNLARWQAECARAGLANRPHVKTHKCVEIAQRQVALGAKGVTCQTLFEAETMVDGGIDNVLIPVNILGTSKLARLAALIERARVTVSVDDVRLVPGLAKAAGTRRLRVLVDCDTGLGRTGVATPEAAAGLAGAAEAYPRVDPEPLCEAPGAAWMQLTEVVGVVPPTLELGALFVDHRRLAPGALLCEPNDSQQVCAAPAVRHCSNEQERVAYRPCLEHVAVFGIAAAAITALRHLSASNDPHATHSTKGGRDHQIEAKSTPERVTPRAASPESRVR
jgi:Alanine racemase, N-terminal domain